jgi:hypothetical protein
MQMVPTRTAAIRMAILLCVVGALDIAAVFLTSHPRLWSALIPALVPMLTPVVIFSRDSGAKS